MKILGPREILNEMIHSLLPTDMIEYEDMLRKALQTYDREHFAQWQRTRQDEHSDVGNVAEGEDCFYSRGARDSWRS